MRMGYFMSSEEFTPAELLDQARHAQAAGFEALWISDHYHPWNEEQGQAPFAWSMIGALSQVCELPITTAVTCPTTRIHPAIIAQAAATSAVLTGGRFALGVGTGEALNEHITGASWPPAYIRREMLAEAIEIIRELWTGRVINHRGPHYTVHHARLYTLPPEPPKIYISGYGPQSETFAAQLGDGFMTTHPDADALARFRADGGVGKPALSGMKGCYAPTEREAREIAHRRWPSEELPSEIAQVLPTPEHYEQLTALVTPEMMSMPVGPEPKPYVDMVEQYRAAGYDELYVAGVGPYYRELIDLFARDVIPAVKAAG
jgi:G6PDH family F420-dependent oxidoreductase